MRLFYYSSGALFFFTSLAKIVAALGTAKILLMTDPLTGLAFRNLLLLTAVIELMVAILCVVKINHFYKTLSIAWLASIFLLYRVGLWWINWHRPCHCLGDITDSLHISASTADFIMKIILAYLLLCSYTTLFWIWRQKLAASPVSTSSKSFPE